jgi:ribosome-associated translation inhibitor RaiA
MNLSISTRHMEHSESVDQMIKEKLSTLDQRPVFSGQAGLSMMITTPVLMSLIRVMIFL